MRHTRRPARWPWQKPGTPSYSIYLSLSIYLMKWPAISNVSDDGPSDVWQVTSVCAVNGQSARVVSIGILMWEMCKRFGIRYIDMAMYHIDMVILDIDVGDDSIDMGYGR